MSERPAIVRPDPIVRPAQVSHHDRTQKIPMVWVCRQRSCAEGGLNEFQFISDEPVCPKCGAGEKEGVFLRTLIHLLIPDAKGRVVSMTGRYRLGCDSTRDYLATPSNREAASGDVGAVNCPECLKEAFRLKVRSPFGERISKNYFGGGQ